MEGASSHLSNVHLAMGSITSREPDLLASCTDPQLYHCKPKWVHVQENLGLVPGG